MLQSAWSSNWGIYSIGWNSSVQLKNSKYYFALAHGFPTILILDSSGFHIKLSEVVKSVAVSVSLSLLLKGSGWPQKSGVTTNQRPVSRSCDHSRPIRSQCAELPRRDSVWAERREQASSDPTPCPHPLPSHNPAAQIETLFDNHTKDIISTIQEN